LRPEDTVIASLALNVTDASVTIVSIDKVFE
jgi:hypothetical protein